MANLWDYALGGYRAARQKFRESVPLSTRKSLINNLRLAPVVALEKQVGQNIDNTIRPGQPGYAEQQQGQAITPSTNYNDLLGGITPGNPGGLPPRSGTPTGGPTAAGGGTETLENERAYREGLITSKYDRLTGVLQRRRQHTAESYDTAVSDVEQSGRDVETEAAGLKGEIDTEFKKVVEEGRAKRDQLQGSIAASFAARGLASSTGATAGSRNADDTFKANVATLDEEKQGKFLSIDNSLRKALDDATREVTRLKAEKNVALEDIDSDLTLTEEERTAAMHDLNVNFESALDSLSSKASSVQAQLAELNAAAEAEALFNQASVIVNGVSGAYNRLKAAGVNPRQNSEAARMIAGSYNISEEDVLTLWDQLDSEVQQQGLYGPAFF